jgi:hypothetical protein
VNVQVVALDRRTRVRPPRGTIYLPGAPVGTSGDVAPRGRCTTIEPNRARAAATIFPVIKGHAAWVASTTVTAATVAFGILNHCPSLPATYKVAHFETRIFRQEQRSPFADRWLQTEIADQIDESRPETTQPLTRAVRTVRFTRPVNVDSSEASVTLALASMDSHVVDLNKDTSALSKRVQSEFDEVEQYLWKVYQREPVKKDGSGDFTWKDQAAAKRMSMSLQRYVISGMDPDFREQLYHAGRAMDADGVKWSILSAFRDDYRQSIASGLKAGAKNSRHGGSLRTGGYGNGQAIDVTGTEGTTMDQVWRWLDEHGGKYGLYRPMPGYDPAHVQSRRDWRKVAQNLRKQRNQLVQHERDKAAKVTLVSVTAK